VTSLWTCENIVLSGKISGSDMKLLWDVSKNYNSHAEGGVYGATSTALANNADECLADVLFFSRLTTGRLLPKSPTGRDWRLGTPSKCKMIHWQRQLRGKTEP
jgi:hypothetical protein